MDASEPLRGLRIAVTGASGFVGSRAARALFALGAEVHGFGRRALAPEALPGIRYRRWDIAEGPLADAPAVDLVVHCAGTVTDWGTREAFAPCHVDGTKNVLVSFPEPSPIVHVSTASVYDPFVSKSYVTEDTPLPTRYLNAYAETKAEAERIVRARTRSIVLRPHAIYGPGDEILLPRILEAHRLGTLLAVGDGTNRISLTHVDNLVDAIVLACRKLARGGEGGTYNVADAEPVVLDQALRAVLRATGLRERILYVPRPVGWNVGHVLETVFAAANAPRAPRLTRYIVEQLASEYTLSLEKAKNELGYAPTRTLFDFLASGAVERPRTRRTQSDSYAGNSTLRP